MPRPLCLLLPLLLATACNDSRYERLDACLVSVEPAVAEVAPGDVLLLDGGPFTVDWDTEVRIAGRDAPVLDVIRDECTPCDACRDDAGCNACEDCPDCARECAPCVQQVAVLVPGDTPAGRQPLVLFNTYGGSMVAWVWVTAPPDDTDVGDTDDTDPGDTDTDTDAGDTDTDNPDTDDTDTDGPDPTPSAG